MKDNLDQTVNTYQENFHKYAERTVAEVSGEFKVWEDEFSSKLPPGGSIFEIGSATGRDDRYLKSKGFRVFCTDVIPQALEDLQKEGFETSEFNFKDKPKDEWKNSFDGFFANAVLLHASQEEFEKSLENIYGILKEGGVVAFSLKTGQGEEVSTAKMDAPRFFKYYQKDELEKILQKYPYEILTLDEADEGKWLHVILKKK